MTPRRQFLKSVSKSAVAAPLLTQAVFGQDHAAATASMPESGDPAYWEKIRGQFMLARDKVFFNNGTIGAMPRVVFERTVEHLRKMATDVADWDYRGENWIGGYDDYALIRGKAAKLLNATPHEIALTENVTEAMSYVASGLDLEPNSEILISDQEHPGGQSAWLNAAKRRGATVTQVKLPKPAHNPSEIMELIHQAITPKTKVIAISHVITGSGAILPVRDICFEARRRDIFTVIDGAQAAGHIAVNIRDIDCDAYVGCFHKWLLAPAGNGFLYLRQDRAKEVWSSICSSQWDNHKDEGYRFTQRGTGCLSLIAGLDAALDFHFEIGPQRVQQRVKYLGDYLREGLRRIPKVKIYSPEDASMCAGITVWGIDGITGPKLQDEMWNRGRLRPRASGAGVRQCTHIFNSPAEIDKTLAIARTLAG